MAEAHLGINGIETRGINDFMAKTNIWSRRSRLLGLFPLRALEGGPNAPKTFPYRSR